MKTAPRHKNHLLQPNAATIQRSAVAYRPPEPFAQQKTVQREVLEYNHTDDEHLKAALEYEKDLDNAVDQSYKHVMTTPRLGEKPAAIDGHTKKWVEDWKIVMENKDPGNLAASFGYAIESLTTGVYLPKPPGGYTLALQGVRETTRPDLILIKNGKDAAWLDITAKKSRGHIWDKSPSWKKAVPHASEILYPSLDKKEVLFMKSNNDNEEAKGFDPEAFKVQLEMSRKLNIMRIEHWKKQGHWINEYWKIKSENLRTMDKKKLNPKLCYQNPMIDVLCFMYNIEKPKGLIEYMKDLYTTDNHVNAFEKGSDAAAFRLEAGNIVAALGLTPSTYGFIGGGANRGMAWLQQFDTKMPQLQDLLEMENKNKDSIDDSKEDINSQVQNKNSKLDKMNIDDE